MTVLFCAMSVLLFAQDRPKSPSAVLVRENSNGHHTFDTLCQFRYGDIVLTEDSITVKKWNSYAGQEEVVLNIIECGANYSRMLQVQGEDTIVVEEGYFDTDLQLELDDSDFIEIVDSDTIFRIPEFFPKFPGGADSLTAYLKREKRWPDNPFLDVSGTVLVEFVVEKDGSVTQPRVKVSLFPEFHDKEALRVVQSMPRWEPATVNGEPVRCFYQMPVSWWW